MTRADTPRTWTLLQIKAANRAAGENWFRADAKLFFKTRLSETTYQTPEGALFVTSEQMPDTHRRYTIRQFVAATGRVTAYGDTWQAPRSDPGAAVPSRTAMPSGAARPPPLGPVAPLAQPAP